MTEVEEELHPDFDGKAAKVSTINRHTFLVQGRPATEIDKTTTSSRSRPRKTYIWWLQIIAYTVFVLGGQSVGTFLGKLYFNNGAKSLWIATLVQLVGFPILTPFRWLIASDSGLPEPEPEPTWPILNYNTKLALIYVALGIFNAADCLMYAVGTQYLPVTTYTLICTSQLGFNALFSYILNGEKMTPYIVNCLVLLSLSSTLLVFEPHVGGSGAADPRRMYAVGFLCTIGASAGYAFMLSATQLAFSRVIVRRRESVAAVVDMSVYTSLVASAVVAVGLFASGDWRMLRGEAARYPGGKAAYAGNLVSTAVAWQVFTVGIVGLVFKVSALFSNVISILGTPLAPVLAVAFLGERMTGLKAVAMVVAMWGLASYMYQHYADYQLQRKAEKKKEEGFDRAAGSGLE